MEKPVIISIRGVQTLEEGQEDVMELVTQGILRQEEGELSLTYLESELTGLEGTTTTFHITPERITLHREGTLNSEMIFQEGQKHFSLYETPYGGLMLGVNTHRAKADFGEDGGNLSIRYALEVDSQHRGERLRDPGDGTSAGPAGPRTVSGEKGKKRIERYGKYDSIRKGAGEPGDRPGL